MSVILGVPVHTLESVIFLDMMYKYYVFMFEVIMYKVYCAVSNACIFPIVFGTISMPVLCLPVLSFYKMAMFHIVILDCFH